MLNKLLGPAVIFVGELLGAEFQNRAEPIPSAVAHLLLVAVLLLIFFWWLRRKLSVDSPSGWQHILEVVVLGVRDLMDSIIGPHGRKYLPFHISLGTFIFLANLIGLVPELESPTANINVTAGCAIIVFLHYNWIGIREQGLLNYLKHFAGPVIFIAPLMIPVEILSHLARPFSLSVRLFANIFGEDMIIIVLTALLPFILPLPIMALAIFTSLLQAFVFVILSIVYISGAAEHHEAHAH
ncbi:MAG: F0F1 ATP synthase subunit A [Acidobacteria bacterium]|nr:F0F1 ATP synthase subunit A [Acidobacteriota bacterium]